MSAFTALFDANVLYPAQIRDLLLQLACSGLFRAKWTEQINDEWIRNVLADRPGVSAERLERTRTLMKESVLDCLVEGYEGLIEALTLPDPNDRHVLAAAIKGRADVIVTCNLADFPASCLSNYGIEAQHPDEFIGHLIDLARGKVCAAARCCRARLRNPPLTVFEYLEKLEDCGLPCTAASLREMRDFL